MPKYNVGDKVMICDSPPEHCNVGFAIAMEEYCGQVATIIELTYDAWFDQDVYRLDVDNGKWKWSDEIVKGFFVEELPLFEVPDEVQFTSLFEM